MLPHPLTNFEIQKYYENKPKFNCVYSRKNLPKITDGQIIINVGEHKSIGTYLDSFDNVTYFDTFGVERLPKDKKFLCNKKIIPNICRKQANDSIMCGYFCIGFINLLHYISLFSITWN